MVYGGSTVPVVKSFKYLCILFSTKLNFKLTCDGLANKVKKAVLSILNKLYTFEAKTTAIFVNIFDAQVQPTAHYGAEIWGLGKKKKKLNRKSAYICHKNVVYLGLFVCLLLFVFWGDGWRTPNDTVYGELGRFPMYLNLYG